MSHYGHGGGGGGGTPYKDRDDASVNTSFSSHHGGDRDGGRDGGRFSFGHRGGFGGGGRPSEGGGPPRRPKRKKPLDPTGEVLLQVAGQPFQTDFRDQYAIQVGVQCVYGVEGGGSDGSTGCGVV